MPLSDTKIRALRDEARKYVAEGIDPRDVKRARIESALEANRNSFAAVAEKWFAAKMVTVVEVIQRPLALRATGLMWQGFADFTTLLIADFHR